MNKQNMNMPEAESVSVNTLRRPLIVLLSVFVALCLLVSALAVFTFVDFSEEGSGNAGGQTTVPGFDYYTALLSDYLTYTDATFKGLTLPGFESRVDAVTLESTKKYINEILLSQVDSYDDEGNMTSYIPKYTEAIDYADEVFLYIVRVEKDGERVDVNYFENAYMETGNIQIGMEYFGKEFDDKLIGIVPADTCYFETRTTGSVDADDVILLSYTVTETVKSTDKDKENEVKNHKNLAGERIDLSEKDAAWVEKLLASYGTIGQYFSFEYEEDIDEDGDKETVKYEGMVDAAVENEHTYTFDATLPADYFGKAPTDPKIAALNGAKLTFTVCVLYSVPHKANTADTLTLGDIAILNSIFQASGVEPFVPSNNKPAAKNEDGALTKASKALSTLRGEINDLKNEIQTLKGDIAKLEGEIAALESEIAELLAAGEEKATELAKKQEMLASAQKSLASKQATLVPPAKDDGTVPATKEETLAEKEAKLKVDEAAHEAELAIARDECVAFVQKDREKTYEERVRYAAGELILDHLIETLTFKALPETLVKDYTDYFTAEVEYYYSMLSDSQKRDYRDIHAYAAMYYGYDEKDYKTYTDYIEKDLVPSTIKSNLLPYGIYNAFINDQSKIDAEIDAFLTEYIKAVKIAQGDVISKDDAKAYFAQQGGVNYLRDNAIYELVVDFLAENNTIDWDTAKNAEKN